MHPCNYAFMHPCNHVCTCFYYQRSNLSKRILLITNIPAPYRIPLFNKLNSELKKNNSEMLVAFSSRGYKRRKWEIDLEECLFNYKILDSGSIGLFNNEKTLFFYNGIYKLLKSFRPDHIIVSGFSIATLKLWFRSFFKRTNYIIWSGSINNKGRKDSPLRIIFRKLLIRRAKGFIVYGSRAKEYLIKLGAKEQDISVAINTTDINFYYNAINSLRNKPTTINCKKVLLYVGHLTRGKRVDQLLKIVKQLSLKRKDFILNIVGDGPEADNLQQFCRDSGIDSMVQFFGFKQKNELLKFYAEADIFLFPSDYDIWGLVLIEAMASGVPCISSINAGATIDFIKDDITGYAVDFEKLDYILSKIEYLLDNPEIAKQIGENAKKFVLENASLSKSAEGFTKLIINHVV